MEKLLILNPGSTSTKIAVYEGETPVFTQSIPHSFEELAPFDKVVEQYEFRKALVVQCLADHKVHMAELSAIVSRGGVLAPVEAGAYQINEDMVWQLRNKPQVEHASNVGPLIAYALSREYGLPAFVYDGVSVDEMLELYRITGLPSMRRRGLGHNLNPRAAAMRYARENGKTYRDITVIVAHLGGGISVNLHNNGRIEDFISDDEGPFSPERSGGLPLYLTIDMCFAPGADKNTIYKAMKRSSGLMAHLGTTDSREVEKRIAAGDTQAKLVYDAMILNTAKNIAKLAPDVNGKLDAIILTGGIAYSKYVTDAITGRVGWICPVVVYPGENEMLALAQGGLRVIRGEEKAKEYHKVETFVW